MANLSLQKFRPGSSILPGSSFRPEPGKQAAELQIDTQKRLSRLALFPNGSPSGYLGPTGDLFCMWIHFFVQAETPKTGLQQLHSSQMACHRFFQVADEILVQQAHARIFSTENTKWTGFMIHRQHQRKHQVRQTRHHV